MLLDEVEQSNSADCQWLGQVLDFLIEDLEFESGDRLEDLLHVELRRDGVVDEMELGDNSWRNLRSTSTGLTHGGNDLEILDVVWLNLLSVIPELVVHPLSDELKRWLGSEGIESRHVEIIDEAQSSLLGIFWLVFVLGPSLEVGLDDALDCVGFSTSGKVDGEAGSVLVKSHQDSINKHGLTDTRMPDKKDLGSMVEK